MKTTLILEKFSPRGDLLEKREQESRSWLKHFFDLLYPFLANLTLAGVNDITSTPRTLGQPLGGIAYPVGTLVIGSPPGDVQAFSPTKAATVTYCYGAQLKGEDVGIVVGTDAGGPHAVTPIQDALVTKVAHGAGAGNLCYGGTELCALIFANPNGQFTIRRYFTNVLGGNISVAEVGMYSPAVPDPISGITAYIHCVARDVVAIPVVVANGEILRVTYVPAITV
jgi:hypothetical protein